MNISPKNRFYAEMTFGRALENIGSVVSAGGMTLEEVKHNLELYASYGRKAKTTMTVVIRENKAAYPKFDWVVVERFEEDAR